MRVPDLLRFQSLDQVIEVLPVQLEDLLQRPQLRLDQAQTASLIDGKKILITGFGVSIGSEIARQIARLKPCKLVVLDASAFLLYSVTAELSSAAGSFELRAVLCNVRERESVNRVFKEERPDIVIHAAALKHVPMLEALPLKGFFTNAIGTRNVAEATLDVGAGDSGTSGPRFVTVLFGNVVGSIGSVVLLFAQQIKAGDPVTVTHPEIELYFMAIPAACLLVLQAAARSMRSEERGGNIILDMGTPVEIVDLARNLIRLSGFCPDVDTKIIYTALRYGEKLLEELFDPGETLKPTGAPGILAASSRFIERTRIERIFDDLHQQVKGYDVAGALRLLEESEPSFNPNARITALMASDRSPSTKMFEERCQ